MLRRVLSFGLELEVLDPDGASGLKQVRKYPHYRIANRVLWAAWRRLPATSYSATLPVVFSCTYADWLISRWIPTSDIFHGWAGLSLTSLRVAKQHGAVTMLENPTMHPCDWQKAVLEECDTFGVRPRDCRAVLPSLLIERMDREYTVCDFIIVPSSLARQSFEQSGHPGKAIVVHAGIDHRFFTPSATPPSLEIFRVCYTGRVELAKGIPYLLQAWKQLALPNAELVLIGQVAPELRSLVAKYALPNVRFVGFLPASQVADWYRASNLFAFPSVNEGLARVLLEAMSSGLPIVATSRSGAEDCITPGHDGIIVPPRDATALADAILWHFRNREQSAIMGKAARVTIEQRFTVSHYEERMISVYSSCKTEVSRQPSSHRDSVSEGSAV